MTNTQVHSLQVLSNYTTIYCKDNSRSRDSQSENNGDGRGEGDTAWIFYRIVDNKWRGSIHHSIGPPLGVSTHKPIKHNRLSDIANDWMAEWREPRAIDSLGFGVDRSNSPMAVVWCSIIERSSNVISLRVSHPRLREGERGWVSALMVHEEVNSIRLLWQSAYILATRPAHQQLNSLV